MAIAVGQSALRQAQGGLRPSKAEVLDAVAKARRLVERIHGLPNRPADAVNGHCQVCPGWVGNDDGDADCDGYGGIAEPGCWRLRLTAGGGVDPETGDWIGGPRQ